MKKTVQSDAKRETVTPEQREPQDQVEHQPSQASEAMKTPEVSESTLESNTSETSQEVHNTEAANEAPGEHEEHGEHGAEDVAAVQDVEAPKVTRARRRKRKIEALSEEEITPRPSYWPIVLACALAVMLLGSTVHPIVLAVGALLVIGCIIGWSLERR